MIAAFQLQLDEMALRRLDALAGGGVLSVGLKLAERARGFCRRWRGWMR